MPRSRAWPAALAALMLAQPASAAAQTDSWTHRALSLQYELASDVELRNAPWVGTHNSFNSVAEMGQTLSTLDSNQRITILEQLDQDMRSLELDLHWFLSLSAGGFAPVVCHARSAEEANVGCTVEKPLGAVIEQIEGWLRAHPGQVLLLYLEDDLGRQGHDESARIIEASIGDLVYKPAAGGGACVPLPMDLTREDVRAAGKQVILVSGCGQGVGWRTLVFDWSDREEERPRGFGDYPGCDPDIERAVYDEKLVRYYEDSTQLTATVGSPDEGITGETAGRLARCGVDLIGFDQLTYDDPRLGALVWSWAGGQPRAGAGRCALQRTGGRWHAYRCRARRRAACRTPDGVWSVTARRIRARQAARHCRQAGAAHAVPRTGYEAQLLRERVRAAGARSVWLGHRLRGGSWVALDAR